MPRKLILLFVALFIFFIAAQSITAQSQKGITVIPSIQTIDLSKDAPEYDLTYVNNTPVEITLSLSAQDFEELEEGYKLSFLQGKDANNYKYSLSSWISFENKHISLSPGEKKTVKIFIDKNHVTRGGHYASILARIEQPEAQKAVTVKGVLSSLLFVRADTGREIEEGQIISFRIVRNFIDFPDSVNIRFQNSGNVYVTPHGLIEVKDSFGKLVAKGIINDDSSISLPESIRRFEVDLDKKTRIMLPGIYKMDLSLHFGESNQRINQVTRFVFIPTWIIILIITGSVAGFVLWRKKKEKRN